MTDLELKTLVTENSKQIAEVWAMIRAVSQQQEKTDKQLSQTDRKIDKLTGKWGRFVESFLAPGIPQAFQEKGININCTMQRLKKPEMEVDILGLDHDCLVVVEVKSTLDQGDIDHFLKMLPKFREVFTEFFPQGGIEKKIYGAVAGIEIHERADRYAYQKGLFVLIQKGETVKIENPDSFHPAIW